jgi:hypothetical protein
VSAFATEQAAAAVTFAEQQDLTEHTTNLDSHANACVAGENDFVVHVLDKKVNVTGFNPKPGKVKDLDLVSGALAHNRRSHHAHHKPSHPCSCDGERPALPNADAHERCLDMQECPDFWRSTRATHRTPTCYKSNQTKEMNSASLLDSAV